MRYTAYVYDRDYPYGSRQLFWNTDIDDNDYMVTSAELTLQAGYAGVFTFKVAKDNAQYGNFELLRTRIQLYQDDIMIFEGRVFSVTRDIYMQDEIVCEGLMGLLNDTVFRPMEHTGNLNELLQEIIDSHNAQSEPYEKITLEIYKPQINPASYREYDLYETSFSRIRDLADSFGVYMYIERNHYNNYEDDGKWGLSLIWDADPQGLIGQTIELGTNIVDIKRGQSSDSMATVVIPLGARGDDDQRLTIESVNSGKDYLEADASYIDQYGKRVAVVTYDDVTTASILKSRGQDYLDAALAPVAQIDLTAIDLSLAGYNVESFKVGEKVQVVSAPHGIDGVWFDVVSMKRDLLVPSRDRLTLGNKVSGYITAISNKSTLTDGDVQYISKSVKSAEYYRSNEMYPNGVDNWIAPAYLTGSGKVILMTINVPKSLENISTISFVPETNGGMRFRGASDYVNGANYIDPNNYTLSITKNGDHQLRVRIEFASAIYGSVTNAALMAEIYGNFEFS